MSILRENVKVDQLFPATVLSYVWPNSQSLNEELRRLILTKEKESAGVQTSNAGGWHSEKNLQAWDMDCIRLVCCRISEFCQEIVQLVIGTSETTLLGGWSIEAWANINRLGHYNKLHHHFRNLNLWSGVYYVDAGDDGKKGFKSARIIFADQSRVEAKNRPELAVRFGVNPEAGLMLLFPSFLGHRVEKHEGTAERITVAFNLRHELFTTLSYEIEKKLAAKKA